MYANFGLPGVVIGSLLLGALTEILSRRFASSTNIRESVFIAICGAVILDLFARGDSAPLLVSFAGLLLAATLVCRRRSPVLAAVHPSNGPAVLKLKYTRVGSLRGEIIRPSAPRDHPAVGSRGRADATARGHGRVIGAKVPPFRPSWRPHQNNH